MEQHSFQYKQDGVEDTGVVAVESFDQKCALLRLEDGLLEIRGGNFILQDMTSGIGKLTFNGKIRSLEYKERIEPTSLFKRLFK